MPAAHASGNRGSHQSLAQHELHTASSKRIQQQCATKPHGARRSLVSQKEHFVPLARPLASRSVPPPTASWVPPAAAPCRRGFGILFCDSFHLYKAVRDDIVSYIWCVPTLPYVYGFTRHALTNQASHFTTSSQRAWASSVASSPSRRPSTWPAGRPG